jgi:hypothetical protein
MNVSNGQESPSPYTEPISDDEPSSDNETTGRVVNANKVHDKSAYGDYLNAGQLTFCAFKCRVLNIVNI